ncbi:MULTISPECIES: glycosyltransferase [Microbacterium]|uniref:glycosyltransferase n=1 Tax=Microbacterium TaxID=33882 RepID=UPI00146B7D20|nr:MULTISPECIES: glycosyltransferase [Microbacterium]
MASVSHTVVRRQRLLRGLAYGAGRLFARVGRRVSWIVGAEEIAGMVSHIGEAIPDSLTVIRRAHAFYQDRYDVIIQRDDARLEVWRRLYLGPLVLGWWLARADGVIYVGAAGFLDADDEREEEFSFVRGRGRAVVCCFTGTDIRSPALMTAEAARTGVANIGSIQLAQGAPYDDPGYEEQRRRRAEVADRLASAVLTARIDQLSYLTTPTEPFLYFYPDAKFVPGTDKFDDLTPVRVLHAPSNPELKGTAIVRAVMERIALSHPGVEYRELSGVGNDEVVAALDQAHIVINQLHAQMPGVFGIEAMARACVMVCSADPAIETDLQDAAGAWVVAGPDDLEARLRDLLASPENWKEQAMRGLAWSRDHASASASARSLSTILARASASARR